MRDTLRVASFNIRNGRAFDGTHSWPLRARATARAIRRVDADVIGLQEVYGFQLRSLVRNVGGYVPTGEPRAGRGGERCPVLARGQRVAMASSTTRWFADEPDHVGARLPHASFPRIATLAVVADIRSGARFGFANLHLDERHPHNRERSAELLLTWLDPTLPWIVVGDFNEPPTGRVLEVMATAGFRSALPADAPGTAHDFTGREDGPRIDHILIGREWEVLSAGVQVDHTSRLPSDHWPVFADVRWRG